MNFIQRSADFILGLIPRATPSIEKLKKVKIVAHRGWSIKHNVLENTFAAFDPCVENSLFGIEFDIRWTKDLIPVVHHDAHLGRLFKDQKFLKDIEFKDLRLAYPEIPSLEEMVARYGKKIHLLIELKKEHFPNIEKQRQILKKILSPLDEQADFHLITLAPSVFDSFYDYEKKTFIIVATINTASMSEVVASRGLGGLMGHFVLLSDHYVKKHQGIKLGGGFPRNLNSFKREINRDGLDWIFTNHPEVFLDYYEKRLSSSS